MLINQYQECQRFSKHIYGKRLIKQRDLDLECNSLYIYILGDLGLLKTIKNNNRKSYKIKQITLD